MSKLFIDSDKVVVADEERWVTIRGNHVLIKNGVANYGGYKVSKFKGAPSREQLEQSRKKAWEEEKEARNKLEEVQNSKDYKKADREQKRIGKELDNNKWYYKLYKPDTGAEMEAQYERNKDKQDAMIGHINKKIKALREKEEGLRRALVGNRRRGFTNVTEREKELAGRLANLKTSRISREMKTKEKADAIASKYNKMAERIKNRYGDDDWGMYNFAGRIQSRGEKLADQVKEKARSNISWGSRSNDKERRTSAELGYRERQIKALNKVKSKVKAVRKASNRYKPSFGGYEIEGMENKY